MSSIYYILTHLGDYRLRDMFATFKDKNNLYNYAASLGKLGLCLGLKKLCCY